MVLLSVAVGCKGMAKRAARRTATRAVAAQVQQSQREKERRDADLRAARWVSDCVKRGNTAAACVKLRRDLDAASQPNAAGR